MKTSINNDEIKQLQRAYIENDGDWKKTRVSLPGVDPVALDKGFRDFIESGKVSSKKKASKGLSRQENEELARLEAEEDALK